MKLNRLETHDRLEHLIEDQSQNIFWGAEDCLKRNSDSLYYQERSPYVYIYAHPRTADDGVTKRMIWQPRLAKPAPQTNSYLFRATSKTDTLEVCWLLPPREMWGQYKKGNVSENELVIWSIDQFTHNREELARSHPQDLPEHIAKEILRRRIIEIKEQKRMDAMYKKKLFEEDFVRII